MYQVEQERADEILGKIKEAAPDLEIIHREEEGWHKKHWQLWFLWLGVNLVAIFNPEHKRRWSERYTVVTSKHIAFAKEPQDWKDYTTYNTLRHEYIHIRDRKAHPLWYPISYGLILPMVWTMRAHWEMRGYTANMIVAHEEFGYISDRLVDHIVKQFVGSHYFWMWPFEKQVRARVREIKGKIERGELKGLYF